jgi:RNA polymerase sigma-70 factor, ECF subfamily
MTSSTDSPRPIDLPIFEREHVRRPHLRSVSVPDQERRRRAGPSDAPRAGDPDAFHVLVDPHRVEIHAHCYRILGSVHDAEDAFQDAMLRAWRGLTGLIDSRRVRPWLYKIATNSCIDVIRRRRSKGGLAIDGGQSTYPNGGCHRSAWVEPDPDAWLEDAACDATPEARCEQREAVELAFVAALQHLPCRQSSVLILREVLGLSAREVAQLLKTTVPSVNSALQRARKTVDERVPERGQQVTWRALDDGRVRDLVERFTDAFERGDVGSIVAMLAEDKG